MPSRSGQVDSVPQERPSFTFSDSESQIIDAIRKSGPLSRTDIARETGYSRAAITSLVNGLLEADIIQELGVGESQGGRRPRLLNLNCGLGYVVGVDLGVTSLDVALADLCGSIVGRRSESSDVNRGPEPVLGRVNELIAELLERHGVTTPLCYAVGVGAPGLVEFPAGLISAPPMPDWEGYPIHSFIQEVLPAADVVVDNDANIMALGELSVRDDGIENFIFLKVGTGIGAGIVGGGELFRGSSGLAGEVGHYFLSHDGPVCPRCGNVGCLEAMAAGPAIASRAVEAAREGRSTMLARHLEGNNGQLSAQDVGEAAAAGDHVSIQIIQDSGRMIGEALAGIVNFYNPGLILIGGGVSKAGPKFLSAIRQEVLRRAHPRSTEDLRIEFSTLGPDAGVTGAIWLALERVMNLGSVTS